MRLKKLLASVLTIGIVLPLFNALTVNAAPITIDQYSFPDPVFRTYVSENYDYDNSGTLSDSEIRNVTYLGLNYMGISDITGVRNFTYLQTLDCEGNSFSDLNLSNMTSLTTVHCGGGTVSTINVSGCTSLNEFSAWGNAISTANFSGAPNITYIDLNSNRVTSINVTANTRLETLWLNNNSSLSSLNVNNNTALKGLYINNCNFSSINVSNCRQLEELMVGGNRFSSLNLVNNTGLKVLDFSNNNITSFDLRAFASLERLLVFGNPCNEYMANNDSLIFKAYFEGNLYEDFDGHDLYEYETPTYDAYAELQCDPEDVIRAFEVDDDFQNTDTSTPTPIPVPANGNIRDFVNRMYVVTLNRPGDSGSTLSPGVTYWAEELQGGRATGLSIAYNFFFSQEYQNKNKSNADFVKDLYKALMGRDVSVNAGGPKYWVDQLNAGASRLSVLGDFANSIEYYDICKGFGVVAGYYYEGSTVAASSKTSLFVARMYSVVMERFPDRSGLSYWTKELMSKRRTGSQIAKNFFFSVEYINKNKTNREIVADFYRAIMGREAAASAVDYWAGLYAEGATDVDIFNSFIVSTEFTNLCGSYGITRGDKSTTGAVWARNYHEVVRFNIRVTGNDEFATAMVCNLLSFPGTTVSCTITLNGRVVKTGNSPSVQVYNNNLLLQSGDYVITYRNRFGRIIAQRTVSVNTQLDKLAYYEPWYGDSSTDVYRNTGEWFVYDLTNNNTIQSGRIPTNCRQFQITASADSSFRKQLKFTWYYSPNDSFASATMLNSGLVTPTRYGSTYYYDCNVTASNCTRTGNYWCVVTDPSTNEVYVILRCYR